MKKQPVPTTSICRHNAEAIFVREKNLVEELMGNVSFTQMMFFDILRRMPNEQETKIVDTVLVTLMEHGLTPSAVSARLVYSSSPEALQGGVAAGLLAAGSKMLGTIENSAELLEDIVNDPKGIEKGARRVAEDHKAQKTPLPGFGHPIHRPDDPRTPRLFEIAEEAGVPGDYIKALKALSKHVDDVYGKHITINASASLAAVLCEIQIPKEIMRGFALICRCAGLVAHLKEEKERPAWWTMSQAAEHAIPYENRSNIK